mmetsp:Transcript_13129/g.17943  ORF Transcript_13129/g.17943 Transcript_13129/m.17943 type:complete len:364 (-) Transcript_13129:45-1136(-)
MSVKSVQYSQESISEYVLKDVNAKRFEYYFEPPSIVKNWLTGLLTDKRDVPILYLFCNIYMIVIPSFCALYLALPSSHWLGAGYLVITYVLFLQRFILGLHYSEHRGLFQKNGLPLNALAPYVLAPLFGIPSGLYRLHHCVMHHIENNGAAFDLSSTEPYQRNNILHFCLYWARFSIGSWFELPYYAFKRQRYDLCAQCLLAVSFYLGSVAALYHFKPVQTLWTLIVPFMVTSFALMFGNWSQHIFIDPSNPESNYGLTYNCVDTPDNQKSFNDGYHIVHHINARCHWSEMPQKYLDSVQEYTKHDALVFRGLGFFEVGVLVMARQLGVLADRWMDLTTPVRSREEKIEILRERLRPIDRKQQ